MLDYACQEGLIENNITERDLFDTRIMNCLMPRPSEVIQTFKEYYKEDFKKATKYFYDLSIASNYIRKTRTDKIFVSNNFINMVILKLPLIYLNQKKIQRDHEGKDNQS